MQPSPPISIRLERFGVWRGAVIVVALLSLAALWRWCASNPEPIAGALGWALTLGVGVLCSMGSLLGPVRPVALRWDGQRWHLGSPDSPGNEPWTGQLSVSIDLGGWLLLRFRRDVSRSWRRVTWLPTQRRGLEHQWQALRCAVYSPRPANDDGSAEAAS